MLEKTNLLGAIVAVAYFASTILIFTFRLLKQPGWGRWLGLVQTLLALLLVGYLLLKAPALNRPFLYYLQVCLFLVFLLVELFLDYILKIDFRQVRWMVITYVTLFFAATGGMLGVAREAGRGWTLLAVILFLIMAVLAFVQRSVTGM